MQGGAERRWAARLLAVSLVCGAGVADPLPVRAQPAYSADTVTHAEPAPPPVRIDAVVTDRAGRRILDLRPSDFDVKVNGEPQALEGVEVRTPPRPRVFAFFLDEYHVSSAATGHVRGALTRFIDTHLRPGDRVVLLKPFDRVTGLQFSNAHDGLRGPVASFAGRKDDLAARSPFEEQFIGRAPETVASARAQIVTLALTEIAVQLGEIQAERAALVLVSEGFRRGTQGISRRQGRLPDLQGVVRAASRYHFSVYALSPSTVDAGTPAGATLEWLAGQTGGVSTVVDAGLEPGLAQVAADLEAYYELRLPAPANNGRFHRVEVTAKRAGLAVRARSGFWAPLSSEVRALIDGSAAPPPLRRRALRRSPLIDAWVGLRPAEGGEFAIAFTWVPTAPAATSRSPRAPSALEVRVQSEQGKVLFEGRLASVAEAARFVAPAGRVEFDMRVLGPDGAELDTDVRDIYVPAFTGGAPLALLPPEVLRARTLPEYRRLLDDPAAVPTPVRAFTRSDRLVIRTPVWQARRGRVWTTAQVLNRRGQPMRALEAIPGSTDGVAAFDLPLAWLAPGEYYIEVAARQGGHAIAERILFRVSS